MQVNVELTMDDIVAFNNFHHDHSPTLRRQKYLVSVLLVIAAGIAILAVILKPSLARKSDVWLWIPVLLIGAAVYPAIYRAWLSRVVRGMFSEGSLEPLLGRKEVSITPVEIVETGASRSTTVRWSCVQRIEQAPDVLYVYISATEAIVLPRRAFADEAAFAAFHAAARQYWEASRARINKA
jgi:hypothetical protein